MSKLLGINDMSHRPWFRHVVALGLVLLTAVAHAADSWTVAVGGVLVGEPRIELSAVVPGGRVDIVRQYAGAWRFNPEWDNLDLTNAKIQECSRTRESSQTANYAKPYCGELNYQLYVAMNRPYILGRGGERFLGWHRRSDVESGLPAIYVNEDGNQQILYDNKSYRWQHVNGEWAEYANDGRLIRWGNRTGELAEVRVLELGTNGWGRWQLLDRKDQVIFTIAHSDTAYSVEDAEGRSIQYDKSINLPYPLSEQFTAARFTDAAGNQSNYHFRKSWACQLGTGGGSGSGSGGIPAPAPDPRIASGSLSFSYGFRLSAIYNATGELRFWADYSAKTLERCINEHTQLARAIGYDFERKQAAWTYQEPEKDGEEWIRTATSAEGLRHKHYFDNQGRLTRWEINDSVRKTVKRDGRKRLETDANGRQRLREYNEWHQVIRAVDGNSAITTYSYDPISHLRTEETDPLGIVTRYEYNAKGWLTRITEAADTAEARVTEYEYNDDGDVTLTRLKGATTAEDVVTSYTYDAAGRVTAVEDPLKQTTAYTRDLAGQVLTRTDPDGKTWTYTWRRLGELASVTDPKGRTIRYAYDVDGRLTQTTYPDSRTQHYTYNARGLLTSQTDAAGKTSSLTYDRDGRLVKTTDASGISETLSYNADGRLAAREDGLGQRTELLYGEQGYLSGVKSPNGGQTTFVTDDAGRTISLHQTVGSQVLNHGYRYDANGQLLEYIDPASRREQYRYDLLGRQVDSTDTGNARTQFVYDLRGNLLQLTDAKGNTHRFQYDLGDRLVVETRPEGEATRYAYDTLGRLTQLIDARGNARTYRYDDVGNLLQETARNEQGQLSHDLSYDYHPQSDWLLGYRDALQGLSASYDYDAVGRKTRETVQYGDLSFTRLLAYEANGSRQNDRHPDGTLVSYSYNAAGLLASIQLPGEGQIDFSDYQQEQPRTIRYPGGLERKQSFDALQRPDSYVLKTALGTTLLELGYTFDPAGNITQQRRGGPNQHQVLTYGYDDQDHLTTVQGGSRSETFTYDKLGNRQTDAAFSDYRYNANNQLTQGQGKQFHYDPAGNLIGETDSADASRNRTLAYNALNRLSEVHDHQNQLIAQYRYDAFGRRYQKTVYLNAATGQPLSTPQTTYYVYGSEGLIGEYDDQGRQLVAYGYVPQSYYGTEPLFQRRNASYAYYQLDHLGTPQQLVTKEGTIVWSSDARAFGETQTDHIAPWVNNLRFPGQYYDAETGLHQNWMRDYNPQLGRYVEQDPIGVSGGLQLYDYARQNPQRFTDPTGEIIPAVIAAGGAAVRLYLRCLARCEAMSIAMGAMGCDSEDNCAGDCLNPLNWGGRGRGRGGPPTRRMSGGPNGPKGGTYKLKDADGNVVRTGRTNDHDRRRNEHNRNNPDVTYEVDRRTDNRAEQRGREQIIYDQHPEARSENGGLNRIRPISPNNPNRDDYLEAGGRI